jgi:hypothetical protein
MNDQLLTVFLISNIVSGISLACTLVNLFLIKVMKKWNGYLAIIVNMCFCQMVYDVSFTLHISTNNGDAVVALWNACQFFGGLSVSLWTNILATIIFRVVYFRRSTDIIKNFYLLCCIALLPSLLLGLLALLLQVKGLDGRKENVVEMVYYWGRIASIVYNFIMHFMIQRRSYQTRTARLTSGRTPQEIAIEVLSRRMIFYPLMQAISRIGATIYEGLYGFGPYGGHTSRTQFGLACTYSALSPATGIGYLLVFLLMQPFAMDQLRSFLSSGKAIDARALEMKKEELRQSYCNRNTLNREGNLGINPSATGSSTNKSAAAGGRSISKLYAEAQEKNDMFRQEESAFNAMDDDELVNTIHRVEQKGGFSLRHMAAAGSDYDSGTYVSNPVFSGSSSLHSSHVSTGDNTARSDLYEGDKTALNKAPGGSSAPSTGTAAGVGGSDVYEEDSQL